MSFVAISSGLNEYIKELVAQKSLSERSESRTSVEAGATAGPTVICCFGGGGCGGGSDDGKGVLLLVLIGAIVLAALASICCMVWTGHSISEAERSRRLLAESKARESSFLQQFPQRDGLLLAPSPAGGMVGLQGVPVGNELNYHPWEGVRAAFESKNRYLRTQYKARTVTALGAALLTTGTILLTTLAVLGLLSIFSGFPLSFALSVALGASAGTGIVSGTAVAGVGGCGFTDRQKREELEFARLCGELESFTNYPDLRVA